MFALAERRRIEFQSVWRSERRAEGSHIRPHFPAVHPTAVVSQSSPQYIIVSTVLSRYKSRAVLLGCGDGYPILICVGVLRRSSGGLLAATASRDRDRRRKEKVPCREIKPGFRARACPPSYAPHSGAFPRRVPFSSSSFTARTDGIGCDWSLISQIWEKIER